MYAACACAPQIPLSAIPPSKIEPFDASGNPLAFGGSEGRATPDGFIVNTSYTTQYPQIVNFTTSNKFVTPLSNPTLGDRLSENDIPGKFYAGGLDNALAGHADYAPGTAGAKHIVDDSNFLKDLAADELPAVSWVKPLGANNEHPGYANLAAGQIYVANLVSAIQMSPAWENTLVVIMYDEAGGRYDHVAPTAVDRFGPSTRVPAIIISPFAKRGYVDHTYYSVSSILKTIELRYGFDSLTARDAAASPLLGALDFHQSLPEAYARKSLGDLPRLPPPALPAHYAGHSMTELDYDE